MKQLNIVLLLSLVLTLLTVIALEGCATAEERAARAAEHAARVKVALTERHYKISIDHMYTMRGGTIRCFLICRFSDVPIRCLTVGARG